VRTWVRTASRYMTPDDPRCKRFHKSGNEPCTLPVVVEQLALLYGVSAGAMAAHTTRNATAFFGIELGPTTASCDGGGSGSEVAASRGASDPSSSAAGAPHRATARASEPAPLPRPPSTSSQATDALTKSIRKLAKKLKAVEALKAQDPSTLEGNQLAKVATEGHLRAQLEVLAGRLEQSAAVTPQCTCSLAIKRPSLSKARP
jgi:hypothetical protein